MIPCSNYKRDETGWTLLDLLVVVSGAALGGFINGIPSSPKNGGTNEKRFIYTFFPGVPAVINGITYQLQPM